MILVDLVLWLIINHMILEILVNLMNFFEISESRDSGEQVG